MESDDFSIESLRKIAMEAKARVDKEIEDNSARYIHDTVLWHVDNVKLCLRAAAARGEFSIETNLNGEDTTFPPSYCRATGRIRPLVDLKPIINSKVAAYFRELGFRSCCLGRRLTVSFEPPKAEKGENEGKDGMWDDEADGVELPRID